MGSPLPSYDDAPLPVRDDLIAAHRRVWQYVAAPGSWWTGAQRVAIAKETRHAAACALCHDRKAALSPNAVAGAHDAATDLPAGLVDAIHRVRTDPGRLSRAWYDGVIASGITPEQYVGAIGVVVFVVSVDTFAHAIGAPAPTLPAPVDGEPSRHRPAAAKPDAAWVPMIAAEDGADLYDSGAMVPNVARAMSLVPDNVRVLQQLSAAQYLPLEAVVNPMAPTRTLSRPQTELLAARVSALHECFY